MDEKDFEALAAVLNPLLRSLDALEFVARHFHPPFLQELVAGVGQLEAGLGQARPRLSDLPEYLSGIATALDQSCEATLEALAGLREAAGSEEGPRRVYRALRHGPDALEALYPLAGILPPVNRFFLAPESRSDEALQQKYLRGENVENTGLMQFGEGPRDGVCLYVPEHYTPDVAWPLVVALHGGSGDGRRFLWSWLREARTRGAIVLAPTSLGPTWAITGEDVDSPNLVEILDFVREQWSIDPQQMLLTGMSDGGTFTYLSGLQAGSPFTHLAPVSSAFHPMFVEMTDQDRLRGLPIHVVHGALDWMFHVDMARQAQETLKRAGAAVTYIELDDLSHCYPRELNGPMLEWMARTAG